MLTSATAVSYGVLMNSGALSFTSETRKIMGMLRFFRVARIVHEICNLQFNSVLLFLASKQSLGVITIAYLKDDMTQILLITIEWLQQLQRLFIQYKHGIAFWEDQLESDFGVRVTINGQLRWVRSLTNG